MLHKRNERFLGIIADICRLGCKKIVDFIIKKW